MKDKLILPEGYLKVYKNEYDYNKPEKNLLYNGKNSITFRAKSIMSRILGGGLTGASNPTTTSSFDWGTTPDTLRVTGIALGNGGHLIYDTTSKTTSVLPKTGIILNSGGISSDPTRPALPNISPSTWGYDSVQDQFEPGSVYEKVENGNVPWDGTLNIEDNNVGVTQPNTTLYSETYRIPLDASDGIKFISDTEVQFKATLGQSFLNLTDVWGFAQQPANLISEAGLITGDATTQLYLTSGTQPSTSNFNSGLTQKDVRSLPPNSFNPDAWLGSNDNTWNMVARKTFPALTKTSSFSLVFVWVVGF